LAVVSWDRFFSRRHGGTEKRREEKRREEKREKETRREEA